MRYYQSGSFEIKIITRQNCLTYIVLEHEGKSQDRDGKYGVPLPQCPPARLTADMTNHLQYSFLLSPDEAAKPFNRQLSLRPTLTSRPHGLKQICHPYFRSGLS